MATWATSLRFTTYSWKKIIFSRGTNSGTKKSLDQTQQLDPKSGTKPSYGETKLQKVFSRRRRRLFDVASPKKYLKAPA